MWGRRVIKILINDGGFKELAGLDKDRDLLERAQRLLKCTVGYAKWSRREGIKVKMYRSSMREYGTDIDRYMERM